MLEDGTFGRVAEDAYGHRNFGGFLAVANGVDDPEVVRMDVIYETPGLLAPFDGSRLNKRTLAAVHVLGVAATEFYGEVLPEYLRGLATGVVDGYGYDYDMVGQRMGLGFTCLLIWAFED